MNYINKGNKPTKTGFGEGVLAAAQKNTNVVGLGADITASVGMNLFAEAYPDRFFSMGIAEQDAAATAAGLALSGKIPVFSTYGVFAAHGPMIRFVFRCATTMYMSLSAAPMPAFRSVPMELRIRLWRTLPPCVFCPI